MREFVEGEQVPPAGQVWPLSDMSKRVLTAARTDTLSPGSVGTPPRVATHPPAEPFQPIAFARLLAPVPKPVWRKPKLPGVFGAPMTRCKPAPM